MVLDFGFWGRDERACLQALASSVGAVPQVVAVKQATTALDQAQAIVALGLALYAGNDDLLLPFLQIGGCGGICVASHLIGVELGRICELVAGGDLDAARELDE